MGMDEGWRFECSRNEVIDVDWVVVDVEGFLWGMDVYELVLVVWMFVIVSEIMN